MYATDAHLFWSPAPIESDVDAYDDPLNAFLAQLIHPSRMNAPSPRALKKVATEKTIGWEFLYDLIDMFLHFNARGLFGLEQRAGATNCKS